MKTSTLPLSLLAMVLLAAPGCRRQQPSTELPDAPLITSFTASAASVAAGATVQLSWAVEHATSIELREVTDGPLSAGGNSYAVSGFEVTVEHDSLFVLTARSETGTDARAIAVRVEGSQASATSFQAMPARIRGGESATLVWTAPEARSVTLTAEGTEIDTQGQVIAGAVTVTPTRDTTYTLTLDGQARTTTVTVTPAILTFTAERTAVESGQPLKLGWSTAGATKLELVSAGRGVLFSSTTATEVQAGSFTDTVPMRPTDGVVSYELRVEKGGQRVTQALEVFVGTGLRVVRFDAPVVAARSKTYTVGWQALAAEVVEVRIDGAPVFRNRTPAEAEVGSFTFATPPNDFQLELVASSARGASVSRVAQVDVVGVPTNVTLTATPAGATAGDVITLTWSAAEARFVRIVDADGQAVFSLRGQRAESGSTTVVASTSTTFTLTADNLVGDPTVTASAAVTVTGPSLDVTQTPALGLGVSTVRFTASAPDAVLVGFPHAEVLEGTRADFIDIRGTGTRLDLAQSPGFTTLTLPFSTFLWGQRQSGPLLVSRAGWMGWNQPALVESSDVALPSTTVGGFFIAPFWDNLTITERSQVHAQLRGDAPNEQLIVQWSQLQVGTDTETELTFQVQVHQNGTIAFQYQTVLLDPSYTSFHIGIQDGSKRLAVTWAGAPVSDSSLTFFSAKQGSVEVPIANRATVGGFVQRNQASAFISKRAAAVDVPQQLAVTEAMLRPSLSVDAGQYLELWNRTTGSLDLSGWSLRSPNGSRFELPPGAVVPANGVLLLGAASDRSLTDDAGVQVSWADAGFSLSTDGGLLTFAVGDASVNVLVVPDGGPGIATVVDPGFFRVGSSTTMVSQTCNADAGQTFGSQSPMQRGTPGAVSGCSFGYRWREISPHFVDISDAGLRLDDGGVTPVTALTAPVTLAATGTDPAPLIFGLRAPVVSMSLDGYLVPELSTSTNATNKTTPSTTVPRNAIAPFWDDLQTNAGLIPESGLYWKRVNAGDDPLAPEGHWIFQWHRVRHLSTSPPDDLTFQVKLFESGAIEYHYGSLISGTTTLYGNGNSATVWLEKGDAGIALTVSANTPDVRPGTAIRFDPQ